MSEQKNALGMDQKTASWFAYIISVISATLVLITEQENTTVRTHAWQSLVLGCVLAAAEIVLGILGLIPFVGIVFFVIWYIIWVGFVVITVICIVKAAQGDIFKIPYIYDRVKDLK